MSLDTILPYVTLGSAILMIIAILLQQRGASLGAGFGSSGELFTTRRGFDKNLFGVAESEGLGARLGHKKIILEKISATGLRNKRS